MSDREELLNQLTGDAPAETPAETQVDDAAPPAAEQAEQPQDTQTEDAPQPGEQTAAFLDSLTEEPAAKKPDDEEASGTPTPDQPAAETPKTDEPKTLDEQEEEALANVKSERGRERIKAVFAERRELEAKATQLEADITQFRDLVKSTGMQPEEFAQTLEFGRLVNSGKDEDLRVALQMVDAQREELARRLGVELPGTDPLADFPDLKADVENMAITKERALEVAKYRRVQAQQQQVQQAQQRQEADMQAWNQKISTVTQTAQTYFATREKEADYPAKMAQIAAKFKDQAFMQEFVSTYQPEQWFGVMKMMYDAIQIPQAPRTHQQPIRSRPALSGPPAGSATEDNSTRLSRLIDSL